MENLHLLEPPEAAGNVWSSRNHLQPALKPLVNLLAPATTQNAFNTRTSRRIWWLIDQERSRAAFILPPEATRRSFRPARSHQRADRLCDRLPGQLTREHGGEGGVGVGALRLVSHSLSAPDPRRASVCVRASVCKCAGKRYYDSQTETEYEEEASL